MINIINISKDNIPKINYFYCGRGSPVGNPFKMKNQSAIERNKVCDNYYLWFKSELLDEKSEVSKFVKLICDSYEYSDITLGCYCAPKKCHCETIREHVELDYNYKLLGI